MTGWRVSVSSQLEAEGSVQLDFARLRSCDRLEGQRKVKHAHTKNQDMKAAAKEAGHAEQGVYTTTPHGLLDSLPDSANFSLESFVRTRGGENSASCYPTKIVNRVVTLGLEYASPWELIKKNSKGPKTSQHWGHSRRVARLCHLKNRKGLTFDFAHLRALKALWQDVAPSKLAKRSTGSNNQPRVTFIGAEIKVVGAAFPPLVGTEGIVVRETANTWEVVGNNGKLKIIPKRNTIITAMVQDNLWSFNGTDLVEKPQQR